MKRVNQTGNVLRRPRVVESPSRFWFALAVCAVCVGLAAAPAPAQTITAFAGNGTQGFSGNGGAATAAALNNMRGVGVDPFLNIYIADYGNNMIRKVTPAGIISTVAGTGSAGYGGDGGPATSAGLNQPEAVAVDKSGNIIVADSQNRRIRRITPNGTISTIAGNGVEGTTGDGGPAVNAQIQRPVGLATDFNGNIYFVDSPAQRVRKIDASGKISTVAGNGNPGYSGDGGAATSAMLNFPTAVALDAAGSLYIADANNNAIRKVSNGVITTVAGNGSAGFGGDGGAATSAQLNIPYGVAINPNTGALYIADSGNNRVRVVTNGVINTLAGNGNGNESGNGGPASSAELNFPWAVATDQAGNLFISDMNGNQVREIAAPAMGNPTLPANATLNAGSYTGTIAPGAIVSIFGSNLAVGTTLAPYLPLPTTLLDTTVTFGGVKAPLFFVSPKQVNAMVPFELAAGPSTITVTRGSTPAASAQVQIGQFAPAVFTMNQQGTGDGAILHAGNYALVSPTAPAAAGEYILIFANGLGPTNPAVKSGVAAPSTQPLATDVNPVTAEIGGKTANVAFAGLAPGFAGLYQLNVQIPSGLPAGSQHVKIMVGGVIANDFTVSTK